ILSLDWTDLPGTLSAAASYGHPAAGRIISCASDSALRNGWSKDSFGRDPVLLVRALLEPGEPFDPVKPAEWPTAAAVPAPPARESRESRDSRETADGISMHGLAAALRDALAGSPACLVRLPLGWHGADLEVGHPLDFLGMDGGAGIGSGPGMAV